jgi:hypothetical protein
VLLYVVDQKTNTDVKVSSNNNDLHREKKRITEREKTRIAEREKTRITEREKKEGR